MLLDPAADLDDATLCCRTLLNAEAYRLRCSHRRRGCLGEEEVVQRALQQAVKEAARGLDFATRCFDSRWAGVPCRRAAADVEDLTGEPRRC